MANKLVFLLSFLVFTSTLILMTSEGSPDDNSNAACAACRLQHRRCEPDCVIRRYFPADTDEVENAHRLFGVGNVQKMMENLPEDKREEAAKAITFEGTARARYPVLGPYKYIYDLQHRIQLLNAELLPILNQLAILKSARNSNPAYTAGELSSPGYGASSSYFAEPSRRVAANRTGDSLGGGEYFASFVRERETAMPSEITDGRQPFPTFNGPPLRLSTATENANSVYNNETAIDNGCSIISLRNKR